MQNTGISKPMPKNKKWMCVGEEVKMAINIALERFRLNEEQTELEFPSSFTANERAYVHFVCLNYGLKSKSKGKKANRALTVTKNIKQKKSFHNVATLSMVQNSRQQITSLLQRNPVSAKERQELQQRIERNQSNEHLKEMSKTVTGRLNSGVAQVPPLRQSTEYASFQQSLPIRTLKDSILRTINENKIIIICGETGSGKTTQVPQMILDECQQLGRPCRIFCTQPRRLAALTIAERVAAERGEKIGQTIGYQIRLESRVSPKTVLTFCTNGVLLRTLMGGEQSLQSLTHIIVDEVHERDRFCDFLLIILRDVLPKLRNLHLILMSADMNINLFMEYFGKCPIINVPGKVFDVQEFFLEDILKWTGYMSKEMKKIKSTILKDPSNNKTLDVWCNQPTPNTISEEIDDKTPRTQKQDHMFNSDSTNSMLNEMVCPEKEELEQWLVKEMDDLLSKAWLAGREDKFQQIFHYIMRENVNVDYVHSDTGATPLMVACGRGFLATVEQLLSMGASIHHRTANGWNALEWANKFKQMDVVELLEVHLAMMEREDEKDDAMLVENSIGKITDEDRELLRIYHQSFDDERVDIKLIMTLLHKIHSQLAPGAILVFLPGYDDIVSLREQILENQTFSESNRYILYILHSQMQSADHKTVFQTPELGVRKIILATNVAESSITINDIVYVVDSGKVKEKSYDALTSVSMLKSHWISKSSALQRKGRAGRCKPGNVYRLFSRVRFEGMLDYPTPELLRHPLHEIVLHTKLLAPPNCLIVDYLSKAPNPPAIILIKNAVHLLKQIDALDPFEDLTELGHHLADLPVEPRFGKMILYAVVLKCLDPILTIACSLAYKDPFLLPSVPSLKRAAIMARRRFSSGTFSDHMAILRAFQGWQKAHNEGWEKSFCERNLLSSSTMEMILGMRTQLLGQLRAAGLVRTRGVGDIRDVNTNSENWAVVKAALCAGTYPNLIWVNRQNCQLYTNKEGRIRFHPTSILGPSPSDVGPNLHSDAVSRLKTNWICFDEMTRIHRTVQVRSCTAITPITVALFAGLARLPDDVIKMAEGAGRIIGSSMLNGTNMQGAGLLISSNMTGGGDYSPQSLSESEGEERPKNTDSSSDTENNVPSAGRAELKLDEWLNFKSDAETVSMIMQLRLKWHALFMRRMRQPNKLWSQYEESTIRTVVNVLTYEEQSIGLQQPTGIGQRPRAMTCDIGTAVGGSRRGSDEGLAFDEPLQQTEHSNVSQPQSIPQWLKDLPVKGNPLCFIIKTPNGKFFNSSENRGSWPAIGLGNMNEKISKAIKEGRIVYFVFIVHGSGYFHGYARICGQARNEKSRDIQGMAYPIEWVKRTNVSMHDCQPILKSLNDSQKFFGLPDCLELDGPMGEQLIDMWKTQPSTRSTSVYLDNFSTATFQTRQIVTPTLTRYNNNAEAFEPQTGNNQSRFFPSGSGGGYAHNSPNSSRR